MLRRRALAVLAAPALAAAAALAVLTAGPATAQQAFPNRTISIIVPFAAGGPTDTVTRLVAEVMGRDLGQTVVVENVGGAGGTLGAARVAQARPDGYTLLLHHIGMGTTPTLYRRLSYDPVGGFETIGLVTAVPMTIIARKDIQANNLAELVALVRRDQTRVNYANAGIGAASHLCGLLLQKAIDAPMTTVPYRGTGPAMTDLIAGTVDIMCDQTTNTTSHIRAGAVRAFAVTTAERLPSLPELPTAAEAGLPGMEVTVWHGLYSPKGTPAEINTRLSRALQVALRDERLVQRFADLGTAPVPQDQATPEAHRAFWQADIAKWRPVIQAAGQYAD
ncbi:tripartite tricarboxylate transporter substrate-binding protein [Pseudoroseomonas cervicalis]|uniref:tripartite tricarboxylate transporter substrate-binding protein n=1 Tax=Teichococcus cervicalis TaxID=204525 RepID=UPI0027859C6A|nr:tripartite tricarboxylate transporter substrate-binding protein [Pseudoroseomonas cervicalis]MDQ1080358.1 tripartite-type tricarboxylate transporter receptor subunit TctC [Pseudoroseomonas cervicalis]